MDEILSLSSFTQPVTLVCAGNRRKEQNQVMQTIGFNWGAAGCGTSLWSGPLLSEVLRKAGVKEDETWNYPGGEEEGGGGKKGAGVKCLFR